MITDIDANVGQISGDFGVEIRLFEPCERRIGLQPLSNHDAARMHDLDAQAAVDFAGGGAAAMFRWATMAPAAMATTPTIKTFIPLWLANFMMS